ncbi:hypothetical protein [Brumimicrobium sp.]|uniref:hypothetical protein n=1 Tax=Brumimicrobium sp. TaxID=2029867 RepID=UPI00263171E0|nr:hypothetical protein [uncultured Brumimicrobium sp.]
MKHLLLLLSLVFVNSFFSQKVLQVKDAFSLSGGMYMQKGLHNSKGASVSVGYQAQFPNRFVFGVNLITDRTPYIRTNNAVGKVENWHKLEAVTGGVQLGVHIVRREKVDLSFMITPHINYQEMTFENRNTETGDVFSHTEYTTLIFTPLVAYRLQAFYKFNSSHSIGIFADVNNELDFTLNGFFDLISPSRIFVGRVLFAYRYTLPEW